MRDETKDAIRKHAEKEYPREACGLILNIEGKERYVPCRNIAERQSEFILEPADFAAAEDIGDIISIVHSHCNQPSNPSQADLVGCESSGLPWHIISWPNESWSYLEPKGYRAPLLGREFSHGLLDCYALIRDWYRESLGIELIDFDRSEEWWKKGGNLYLENFEKAGFRPVENVAKGDVILMQVASPVVNHAGIYLGDDVMIHHLMGRLSCREVYGGYWRKHTRMVIRYGAKP